jgi:hypothetical protein
MSQNPNVPQTTYPHTQADQDFNALMAMQDPNANVVDLVQAAASKPLKASPQPQLRYEHESTDDMADAKSEMAWNAFDDTLRKKRDFVEVSDAITAAHDLTKLTLNDPNVPEHDKPNTHSKYSQHFQRNLDKIIEDLGITPPDQPEH